MLQRLTFFLFLILAVSCNENKNSSENKESNLSPKVDSLYKLVVAKHDEVMPKTADISKLMQLLRAELENIGKDKAAEENKEKILGLITNLQSAYDAMFDWMGDFKGLHTNKEFYEKKPEKELLEYLKTEETKIERVAKMMLESIGYAELYFSSNGTDPNKKSEKNK